MTSSRQMFNFHALVPEAYISGWSCAHSPGHGSCFISTAAYIGRILSGCRSCNISGSYSPPLPTNSQPILPPDDPVQCPRCARAVSENIPTCGGKFLGIGSKREGKSCKLIDGTGCWPLYSAPVSHDCGRGKECRFKVSRAKAKIWYCRERQRCKWYQIGCHTRNTFRCSNQALSKSKDKNGAQVLWEE